MGRDFEEYVEEVKYDKTSGLNVVEWNHSLNPGIVWRFPDYTSSIPPITEQLARVDAFNVKEYERAVFVRQGKIAAVVPSGTWLLKESAKQVGTEIVWVDQRPYKTRWGVSEILTLDDVSVGSHGVIYVKVGDPSMFLINLVTANRFFTPESIESFIKEHINSVIKSVMATFPFSTLMRERDVINAAVRAKCKEMFSKLGLELMSLDIMGYKVPEEYMKALQKTPLIEAEMRAERLKATSQADIRLIEAEAAAREAELYKKAELEPEAEFYMKLAEKGLDVAELERERARIKAIEKARVDQISVKYEEGARAAESSTETEIKNTEKALAKLAQRFADGEISEEAYNKARSSLEKYLSELKAR
ncbi:MAG: SPFH domain-containing protein [Candidatus Jordarchaeaceae archaeon]